MNESKWLNFVQMIKDKFAVQAEGQETTDIPGAVVKFIEWKNGDKEMRAEFHIKPKVLDKKTFYSRRIGSGVKEEYIYAADEKVEFAKFFEKSTLNDEWQEINIV